MSVTLETLLKTRIGYRNEHFQGSGMKQAYDVIGYEIQELYNTDIIDTMSSLYNLDLSKYMMEDEDYDYPVVDMECSLDLIQEIMSFLEKKFKTDKQNIYVVWVTTAEAVKKFYSFDNEEPELTTVSIKDNWLPISDIDTQGILFAYTE
jgi:hypothetical protein